MEAAHASEKSEQIKDNTWFENKRTVFFFL
jgi:hypothetical protein